MRTFAAVAVIAALQITALPAEALDGRIVERLALCQDSWFDWKTSNPAQLQRFIADVRASFPPANNQPYFTPTSRQAVVGLPVAQIFPQSVGMGVGFSVMVQASFATAKASVERAVGKPLGQCEAGEGMRGCELQIAEKRNLTVAAEDSRPTQTLIGCYYFYEK